MARAFDDVLNECVTDLLSGRAGIDELVLRYPEAAQELRPLLEVAARLRPDGVWPFPDDAPVEEGWRRLAAALQEKKTRPAAPWRRVAAVPAWLFPRNWGGRARAAVVVGAVGLVGASGFAAAAGGVPDVAPFRFFGSSGSSGASVTPAPEIELEGVVRSVDGAAIGLDVNGVRETVVVDARTEIRDPQNNDATILLITPGAVIKVEGVRRGDGALLAREVKLLAAAPATPAAPQRPAAGPPTVAPPAFGRDCDPSGPGNPCKGEDRSGPGPNAGPGNADDGEDDAIAEEDDDRKATPTRTPEREADDDERDDSSGSGSDDEADDEEERDASGRSEDDGGEEEKDASEEGRGRGERPDSRS